VAEMTKTPPTTREGAETTWERKHDHETFSRTPPSETAVDRASRRRRSLRFEPVEHRMMLSTVSGDFNGDGYRDLAIGVPFEDVGSIADAGAVNVLYGRSGGLSAWLDQIWDQNSAGVGGAAEAYESFGQSLAGGDFNGDGLDDLAIGVPGQDVDGVLDAGAVDVLYGRIVEIPVWFGGPTFRWPLGLSSYRSQEWHQNRPGIEGEAERGDRMGWLDF